MRKLSFILVVVLIFNLGLVSVALANEGEGVFTLEEIVVTASRYPEELSESPVSVEVIDEADIKKMNSQNAADLVSGISSVKINDHGGIAGKKTISIRGSSPSQVLVLIDGQPMNNSQNGQIDLGQLTTDQIKKIEVLRGPASAIYGANALGGVVNIITEDGSEELETSLKTGFGSFNTKKYNLTHRGSAENSAYNVSLTKKESDGHRQNSDLDQLNAFTKFNYEVNNYSDLTLSLRYSNSKKGVPGKVTNPTPNAEQKDRDQNINLKWERNGENNDLKVTAYHNRHELTYDNPDEFGYDGASNHETMKSGVDFNQTLYFKDHTLIYGAEAKENKIDSNENGEHQNLNKALFIQDKWEVNEALKINLGGRGDFHDTFGTEFSPRLGAVYSISDKVNVHTSVSKAYRTPTFNDLYWPADAYAEGNPDLKPETAVAYEVGSRYLNQKTKINLNYFKRDVEDLIDWAQGEDGKWRPYNVNSAEIKGVELDLTRQLLDNMSTGLNYTYLDARSITEGKRLSGRPYHQANFNISYDRQLINAALKGELVDGRSNDLPTYVVLDARLGKEFALESKRLKLVLKINNLLDKDYEIMEDYPVPGRNYILELSTKF